MKKLEPRHLENLKRIAAESVAVAVQELRNDWLEYVADYKIEADDEYAHDAWQAGIDIALAELHAERSKP